MAPKTVKKSQASGNKKQAQPTKQTTAGTSSGGNKQNRVQNLTTQAKNLIATASDGAIADPAKFKTILGKLKDLGKDKKVKTLRTKKQAAVAASRPKEVTSVTNNETTSAVFDDSVFQASPTTTYTPGYESGQSGYVSNSSSAPSGPSWDDTYSQDVDKWLSQYQSEQAGRASDYQSMLNDLVSQEGMFDPDLFRSLLGELESSKKRQKEWNERSAREAYKY